MSWKTKLEDWHQHHLISDQQLQDIQAYEEAKPGGVQALWHYGLTGLAVLCVCLGILFIVAANWQVIPFSVKLAAHITFNLGLGGLILYMLERQQHDPHPQSAPSQSWRIEAPLLVLAALQLSLMALIGQHFHLSAPIRDVLLVWWLLIAPMLVLLGRHVPSALLFFGLGAWLLYDRFGLSLRGDRDVILTVLTGAYLVGHGPLLVLARPHWMRFLRWAGLVFACVGGAAVLMFRPNYWQYDSSPSLLVPVALILLVAALRYGKTRLPLLNLVSPKNGNDEIMILGLFAWGIGVLLPSDAHLLSLLLFCFYFLAMGYIAHQNQRGGVLAFAITAITARLVAYFASITDNMLMNGVLMLLAGFVALALIYRFILKKGARS